MEILVRESRKECLDQKNPWGAAIVAVAEGETVRAFYPPEAEVPGCSDYPLSGAPTAAEALERAYVELHNKARMLDVDLSNVVQIHAA